MVHEISLDLGTVGNNEIDDMEAFPISYWAKKIDVCDRTIYRAIQGGELECLRIGRAVRITKRQFAQYLNAHCMGAKK